MKIWKSMTRDVVTCSNQDTLETAARRMWDHDLGALPVVDEHERIVGMITDRDICMAAYTRGSPLGSITVRETMSTPAVTCSAEVELADVEGLMRRHQVHRIPIVDDGGRMVGIITTNDIARAAEQGTEASPFELALTLAAVSAPRRRLLDAA